MIQSGVPGEHHDKPGLLTTIGYGDRPWEDFLGRLRRHGVEYVADVRSHPRSRLPEYEGEALRLALPRCGIKYVFMGDELGGKPDDPRCYVGGKVDYAQCETRPAFIAGLDRLAAALHAGHRVALLCSELDPERCHRSKLIGQALLKRGIPISHIDRDGSAVDQERVIERITGGQAHLFGESFMSVGTYVPGAPSEDN